MKAITYDKYGDPDVLRLSEVDTPKVGPGEIRIRVRAAGVNPVDWKIMQGHLAPMTNAQFPVIPGWDVAGVVEEVGLDVPEYEVGDEVLAYGRKDWLEQGSFAEQMTLPVRTVAPKPENLSWEEAASLPLAGLTAFQTLLRLGVTQGDTVLVHAASGGVGSMAVQIAQALGANVIGTASEANQERVRELGAEPVVYGDGLVDRMRELAPDGVDVAVDYVGGVVEDTLAVLREGGSHGSIADPSVAEHGGLYMWVRPDSDDLTVLVELVEDGELRVDVAETYPLEQAADAFRSSMKGHTAGKIALRVSE